MSYRVQVQRLELAFLKGGVRGRQERSAPLHDQRGYDRLMVAQQSADHVGLEHLVVVEVEDPVAVLVKARLSEAVAARATVGSDAPLDVLKVAVDADVGQALVEPGVAGRVIRDHADHAAHPASTG